VVLEGIVQDVSVSKYISNQERQNNSFQKIEFGVEAFNLGLNEDFVLDKYEIDLTQYPTDWRNNSMLINHHSKLNSGTIKNG
jgi:hypothetical protein